MSTAKQQSPESSNPANGKYRVEDIEQIFLAQFQIVAKARVLKSATNGNLQQDAADIEMMADSAIKTMLGSLDLTVCELPLMAQEEIRNILKKYCH